MKRAFFLLLILLLITGTVSAQIAGIIDTSRITDWENAGLTFDIEYHSMDSVILISDYLSHDSTFVDGALSTAIEAAEQDSTKKIILFASGEYNFRSPINLPDNIIIKGVSSDSTQLIFNLNNQKNNCININGTSGNSSEVTNSIIKSSKEIFISPEDIVGFIDAELIELYQGENEYGTSSSGAKQYQRGQILKIASLTSNSIITESGIRLSYNLFDQWDEPLMVRPIFPIRQVGIEDVKITREDQPPANGGSIINFSNAFNCWIYGVESNIGANYHVSISRSKNIEIKGSYFHHAYNYGGGGNGYGVNIGGNSADCLIENNIFQSLRHSMIISTGASGNVFGYNSSFDKPLENWDEASLSIHGHYAYLNLFEGNYAEFANEDFVWGQNGPFNTFLRNYIYHEGFLFGIIHNQELLIEDGNDSTNIAANLADVNTTGSGDYLTGNFIFGSLPENQFHNEYSYYYSAKPNFISDIYSWPCFGLSVDSNQTVRDSIPAMTRFYSDRKTIKGPELLITEVKEGRSVPQKFSLLQNYPNPFNPSTIIEYSINAGETRHTLSVHLKIYDILGREVATLVNKEQVSGNYQIIFDAAELASGIYIYTLLAGSFIASKKMILLR